METQENNSLTIEEMQELLKRMPNAQALNDFHIRIATLGTEYNRRFNISPHSFMLNFNVIQTYIGYDSKLKVHYEKITNIKNLSDNEMKMLYIMISTTVLSTDYLHDKKVKEMAELWVDIVCIRNNK